MLLFDSAPVSGTRRTREGYLVADVRIARAGNIQVYGGAEVGKPDMPTVRVYRPEEAVFDKAAMASFCFRPITNDHPSAGFVTADNWRDLAVGLTGGEVARDGEFLRLPMCVMDSETIGAIESGKREVSCGYSVTLDWEPGVTPSGEPYDAKVGSVVGNHLAVVGRGRAGSACRIGDAETVTVGLDSTAVLAALAHKYSSNAPATPKGRTMADEMRAVVVDGLTVHVPPQGFEAISKLQREIGDAASKADRAETALRDAQTAHATALQAKDGEIAALKASADQAVQAKDGEIAGLKAAHEAALQAKDAEIAVLQAQVSDEALEARAAARSVLVGQAKAFLGDGYDPKGKSDADIRKDVVLKYLGDKADPSKPAVFFDHAFEVVAAKPPAPVQPQVDPLRAAIASGAGTTTANDADKVPGWQKAAERASKAWMSTPRTLKGNA